MNCRLWFASGGLAFGDVFAELISFLDHALEHAADVLPCLVVCGVLLVRDVATRVCVVEP